MLEVLLFWHHMTHFHASSAILPWVFFENKFNCRKLPQKCSSDNLLKWNVSSSKGVFVCFPSLQKTNGNLKEEMCSCTTTSSFKKSLFNRPWCWHELPLGLKWGETRRSSDHWPEHKNYQWNIKAAGSSTLRTISHPGSSDWMTASPAWV